jgi:predicted TIM-barrel fold metal-dependent hydrolase
MHIQSNKCAPKPLKLNQLKRQNYFQVVAHLFPVTIYSSTGWGGGLGLGGKSEEKIGKIALEECEDTYKKTAESTQFGYHSHREKNDREKEKIFTIMVAQMMDMEYAHLAGYEGQRIYHEEDGECFYYKRKSGLVPENQGKKRHARARLRAWKEQLETTRQAILSNPWKLLCMYKYEPRRWRLKSGETEHPKLHYGAWDYPFQSVATKTDPGIFVGFKVYPPLGFQPLDTHLPHLWDYTTDKADCFYGRCEKKEVPILSHCSPGGMTTHEIMYYKEYYTRQASKYQYRRSSADNVDEDEADEHIYHSNNKEAILEAEQWFYQNHVHPSAWRNVLEKFPKLKLCLAHFGGDLWKKYGSEHDWIQETIRLLTEKDGSGEYRFPNVYTDIACWNISRGRVQDAFREVLKKVPELKKRLLFGSDWHMITIVSPFDSYDDYCEKWKQYLDEIDDKLWVRITLVNAFKFYGLSDGAKLRQINEGMVLEKADVKKRIDGFEKIIKVKDEVENLKKALEQWDQYD